MGRESSASVTRRPGPTPELGAEGHPCSLHGRGRGGAEDRDPTRPGRAGDLLRAWHLVPGPDARCALPGERSSRARREASSPTPPEGGALGLTSPQVGALEPTPPEGGALGFTSPQVGALGQTPPEGGAPGPTPPERWRRGPDPAGQEGARREPAHCSRQARPPERTPARAWVSGWASAHVPHTLSTSSRKGGGWPGPGLPRCPRTASEDQSF